MTTQGESAKETSTVRLEELARGAVSVPHHALLLVGSRLPEDGLPAWAFHGIARFLCGIAIAADPHAPPPLGKDEPGFWEKAASHPDVVIVDREAPNVKLEHVAPIRDRSLYPPTQGRRRLFFVDRCERLPAPTANALLKVLEEPAAPALFLFTARSLRNVLPTIASRCQRLAVSYPRDEEAAAHEAKLGARAGLARAGLEDTDAEWLWRRAHASAATKALSAWGAPEPRASALREVLEAADALGRKYPAEALVEACLAATLAAHRAGAVPLEGLRFVKEDLRAWREAFPYNPSSTLWLARVLLRLAPA